MHNIGSNGSIATTILSSEGGGGWCKLQTNFAWIPIKPATMLMMLWASLPVLPVQATEVLALALQEPRGEDCGKKWRR